MMDEKRALEMYELALPLVQAKGHLVTIGVMTFKEYRTGRLSIIYMPSTGHLDVWQGRKVLAINQWQGTLRVTQYRPGDWEQELGALGKPLKHRGD